MRILTICGSASSDSSNASFLDGIEDLLPEHDFIKAHNLTRFPLFNTSLNEQPPTIILEYKELLKNADLVIISTPEYIHNIPAVLKNALEWVTSSGVFSLKKTIAITYTPCPPRGEKAMTSLIASLKALDAKIVCQLPLYKTDLQINKTGNLVGQESIEAIKTAIEFS